MSNTPDHSAERAFEVFCKNWNERSPKYCLDDPEVRDRVMSVVSCAMFLLHERPILFNDFYLGVASVMDSVVPKKLKRKVEVFDEHPNKPMHN